MSEPTADTPDADVLSLTVTLAGRPYPLRVAPRDEAAIRRISKELNDKVADFQRSYVGKDKQDCLAMLLLIYAVDLYKVKDAGAGEAPIGGTLPADAIATIERLKADITQALADSASDEDLDAAN